MKHPPKTELNLPLLRQQMATFIRYGYSGPCTITRVRDGDTVEIGLDDDDPAIWAIRLIDCWAAERHTSAGKAAKHYLEAWCEKNGYDHWLVIPPPKDHEQLLKNVSFDRIPAHIYVSAELTLSALMVAAGHATETKGTGA